MKQTLILTGDINLQGVSDPAIPFAKISDVTREADVLFGNLECCFYEKPDHDPAAREGFFAPPAATEALVTAGFDAVGCANNVTYGEKPILSSLARLDAVGIAHTGAGRNWDEAHRPAIVEKAGQTFGFVQRTSAYWPKNHEAAANAAGVAVLKGHTAYRPVQDELAPNRPGVPPEVLTWADPAALQAYCEEISDLSDRVDFLVASHHWGFRHEILAYQTEIAHAAIDAGADFILGHGPHEPLGVELYKGKPILYGACNFSFNIGHNAAHPHWIGMFATVLFEDQTPYEVFLRFVRRTSANETILRLPAEEPETVAGVAEQSAAFDTKLIIEDDRLVIWRSDTQARI